MLQESQTIISSPSELEGYSFIEQNSLLDTPSYNFFLNRVTKGFQIFSEANNQSENRPYQVKYAAMFCVRRLNMMVWAPRSGKTLTALLTLYGLYGDGIVKMRKRSIHIIVPSLLATMSWVKELERFPVFKNLYTVVNREKDYLRAATPIVIYRHDFAKNRCKSSLSQNNPCMSHIIQKDRPTMLIVDEVHEIRRKNERSKHLNIIRNKARRVLALTGTPSEGNLIDIHNLLHFVYRRHWVYRTVKAFTTRFSEAEYVNANYLYGTDNNIDSPDKYLTKLMPQKRPEYYQLISRYWHRLSLNDEEVRSCITLPKVVNIMQSVEPKADTMTAYYKYISHYHVNLRRAMQGNAVRNRAEALSLINPLIKLLNSSDKNSAKLDRLKEIVRNSTGKVVVFCDQIDSARIVYDVLHEEFQDQVVRIRATDNKEQQARMSEDERIAIVTQFQEDPSVKVGVFSINLAFQAIDLSAASDIVYYCLCWSSLKIQQSISRPVSPTNKNPEVNLHWLYTKNAIDEYQVKLAAHKIEGSNRLLDYEVCAEQIEDDLSPNEVIRRMLQHVS